MLPGHRCQQGHPWIAVAGHVPLTDLKNSAVCYAHHRQHAFYFPPVEGRSYLGKVWVAATQLQLWQKQLVGVVVWWWRRSVVVVGGGGVGGSGGVCLCACTRCVCPRVRSWWVGGGG